MIERPKPNEFAPFYASYVALVADGAVAKILQDQPEVLRQLAASVPPEKEQHRYEEGKWSVREVFGHLGDAERAFAYRLFCFSRGESAPLPGFDESSYVAHSRFHATRLLELVEEFAHLRSASLALLRRLEGDDWSRAGTANGNLVTTRALAYIMAGHVLHHVAILRSRYVLGT